MTHQAKESQMEITSDILLQAFFMFSFYYFCVFFTVSAQHELFSFSTILRFVDLYKMHCCNVSIDVQCSYHTVFLCMQTVINTQHSIILKIKVFRSHDFDVLTLQNEKFNSRQKALRKSVASHCARVHNLTANTLDTI